MTERSAPEPLATAAVDTRSVTLIAVLILLFLAASMGILTWVFFAVAPSNRSPAPNNFPRPQLQAHPAADLRRYLDQQRSELSGYHWSNSEHTLLLIPIERAMEIIAQRGAKGYEPIAPPRAAAPPQSGTRP